MSTKKGTGKRTNYKRKSPEKVSPFAREITFIVIILFCILMLLSFFDLCGVIGNAISHISFGLFGILAYLFPVLLLVAAGFSLSNPNNHMVKRKIIYCSLMYLAFMAVFQWIMDDTVKNVWGFYTISAKNHSGGGLLGGCICYVLEILLGRVGSLLVLIALIILLFIFLSRKLLFASLRDAFVVEDKPEKEPTEVRVATPRKRMIQPYTFPKEDKKESSKPVKQEENETSIEKRGRRRKERLGKADRETPATRQLNSEADSEISIIRQDTPLTEEPVPVYKEEMDTKFGKKQRSNASAEAEVSTVTSAKSDVKKKNKETLSEKETEKLHKEMDKASQEVKEEYKYPSYELLNLPKANGMVTTDKELIDIAKKLQDTLESFGVHVRMGDVSCGPSVTRFELIPEQGVKVSKITSLSDDIKLSLAASDIRIEAPIPGKAAVGIEVPNTHKSMVTIRELLESREFKSASSKISFAVGKDIAGKTVVTDIAKMPHLLVAGATGSGKSVCINTLIMSILYKAHPDEVKLILIDPKQVEFQPYNDIPHLMIPVVTDPKKASAALSWAVNEMTKRYQKFVELGVRDMKGYNKRIEKMTVEDTENFPRMPQIVIIVDEFADLMMVAPGEVEDAVCRLAQLARAAGIHLVLATQRPSVNVITGLIKANIPSRIALSVSSAIDSRTIIDSGGAEKLLGNGDMLFAPGDYPKPVRVQGAFVSDKEVERVVNFLKEQFETPSYNSEVTAQIESTPIGGKNQAAGAVGGGDDKDELFIEAGRFIIEKDKASIGMLQRVFRIGFNRAARIMDQLSEAGVVGPEEGTKPRTILMSAEQFENYLEEQG